MASFITIRKEEQEMIGGFLVWKVTRSNSHFRKMTACRGKERRTSGGKDCSGSDDDNDGSS